MAHQIRRIARHEAAVAVASLRGAVPTALILSGAVWAAHVLGTLAVWTPIFVGVIAFIVIVGLITHVTSRIALGPLERRLADANERLARAKSAR